MNLKRAECNASRPFQEVKHVQAHLRPDRWIGTVARHRATRRIVRQGSRRPHYGVLRQAGIPDRLFRRGRPDRPDHAGEICRTGRAASGRISWRGAEAMCRSRGRVHDGHRNQRRALRSDYRSGRKVRLRPDFHGLARPPRDQRLPARQRNQQGADPFQGAGSRLSRNPPAGACGRRQSHITGRSSCSCPAECGTAPCRWWYRRNRFRRDGRPDTVSSA